MSDLLPDTIMARPVMGLNYGLKGCTHGPWATDDPYGNGIRYVRASHIETLNARMAKLQGALQEVHDDLIERAKAYSKDGKTVAVGNGVWLTICAALEEK